MVVSTGCVLLKNDFLSPVSSKKTVDRVGGGIKVNTIIEGMLFSSFLGQKAKPGKENRIQSSPRSQPPAIF